MRPGTNTANVERLSALMDREGLTAVVLRSGTNFTHLAGFDYAGTLARHLDFSDSSRAACPGAPTGRTGYCTRAGIRQPRPSRLEIRFEYLAQP